MNSTTGESGPVNTDRPKLAVSHEVPGCVERPGPVTPPVGLEGRAPIVARWRLRAGGILDDNACCTCCTTGHTLRTSLTPSTREALARVATHTLGRGYTPCLGRRSHPTKGRLWCVQRVHHRCLKKMNRAKGGTQLCVIYLPP
jgi:hypothetical protein